MKQLEALISVITSIDLKQSAPKEISLNASRQKYFNALKYICKNKKMWLNSQLPGTDPVFIKASQSSKRRIRKDLNKILGFSPTSKSYDLFIDGTYPQMTKWISNINKYVESIAEF